MNYFYTLLLILYHRFVIFKMVNILRFKLSNNVMESINQFAIKNKSLDRKMYKEEWNKWMELNERIVNEEIKRMNNLGYNECVKDKMFKAGRYYFRKKAPQAMKAHAHEEAAYKRQYIKLTSDMLDSIDSHIKRNIMNKDYTPANGHKQFCLNNIDILREEKKLIDMNNIDEFLEKIKKTYKNRYFIINKKNNT